MSPHPLRPSLLRGLLLLVALVRAPLVLAGDRALLTPGDVLAPDVDAPATERDETSVWSQVESDDAAAQQTAASSAELVAERTAEQGYTGALTPEPAVEFYLDPLTATRLDPLQLETVDPKEFDIPVVVNDAVKKWMTYFLGTGRKYYARYLMRSTRWMPMMHAELEARGMPKDLVYLSMIESGFTTSATSYVSAAGLWQFMPATGRQYGLRVDWWVDDRRDPVKSTSAALDYLSYLHKLFEGDWWLAWASYNGGEGRVMKETRRHGTTDFWTLVDRGALHSETQNYVPKLIAAAIIGKHPERYGFVGVEYQPAFSYDEAEVPGATGLDVIARCAGVPEETLLEYNPGLRRWALPPDNETWKVKLPKGTAEAFAVEFAKVPPEERVSLTRHVVKRKESLGSIAKKYGVSAEEIARLNHLKAKSSLKVGQELVVPARPGSATLASVATPEPGDKRADAGDTSEASGKSTEASAPRTHKVRSGDTLSSIAGKYDITVDRLRALNDLRGDKILIGQTLKVSGGEAKAESAEKAPAKASSSKESTAKAKPEAKSGKTVSYTVKRGDTLGTIAERYDCSVSELKSWNSIKGTTIYPGQKLKIKR